MRLQSRLRIPAIPVARAVAHAAEAAGVARNEVPSDYMLDGQPFRALLAGGQS